MSTASFIRRELKREVRIAFSLSKRNHKELFLRVVEDMAAQHGIPLHGRRTAVFLLLLRRAVEEKRATQDVASWHEREIGFVRLTREQEETMVSLRREIADGKLELETMQRENGRLRDVLRYAIDILESVKT